MKVLEVLRSGDDVVRVFGPDADPDVVRERLPSADSWKPAWKSPCPAHRSGTRRDLTVYVIEDVLRVHCRTGCKPARIAEAIGVDPGLVLEGNPDEPPSLPLGFTADPHLGELNPADLVDDMEPSPALFPEGSKRAIDVGPDLAPIVDRAQAALLESGAPVYQRAGRLVQVRWSATANAVKVGREVPPSDDERAGADARPEILAGPELGEAVDAAVEALRHAGNVYVRDGLLVAVTADAAEGPIRRDAAAPRIVIFTRDTMLEALARSARWYRTRRSEDGGSERVYGRPDGEVARALVAERADALRLPRLAGVVSTPVLRPDGTVLERPGYDPATELLYRPATMFPPVPSRPTQDDVTQATRALLEPLEEFRWESLVHDRPAAIAGSLTPLARHAIGGAVPLFAVDGTAPGCGKGLLTDVMTIIGTGRRAARMTVPRDRGDEEMRKAILAIALEGDAAILLDNVSFPLGTDALCSIVTDLKLKGRLLGVSRMATVSCRASWYATGNGLRFVKDFGRRVFLIRLDPKDERPELRRFSRNLLDYLTKERARLTVAGLTLLRAFSCAGRPSHGGIRIGSFEDWDDLVRGAMIWAGLGDPAAGRERVYEAADADFDALRGLAAAIYEVKGGVPWTCAELLQAADGSDDLRQSIEVFCDQPDVRAVSLGKRLEARKGRVVEGKRIVRLRELESRSKVARWRVEVIS